MMCSPQGGLSMGKGRFKVVMSSCQGSGPASGNTRAQQPQLGRVTPLPHLANGKGRCPRLCGLHWHTLPRERTGV